MLVYTALQSGVLTLVPNAVAVHFLFFDRNRRCVEEQVRRSADENCRQDAGLIWNKARRHAIAAGEEVPTIARTAYGYETVELMWI